MSDRVVVSLHRFHRGVDLVFPASKWEYDDAEHVERLPLDPSPPAVAATHDCTADLPTSWPPANVVATGGELFRFLNRAGS